MTLVFPEKSINRSLDRRNAIRSVKVIDSNIKSCSSCFNNKNVNLIRCNKCCKQFCSDCLLPKYTSLYCYDCADRINIFTCCFN